MKYSMALRVSGISISEFVMILVFKYYFSVEINHAKIGALFFEEMSDV